MEGTRTAQSTRADTAPSLQELDNVLRELDTMPNCEGLLPLRPRYSAVKRVADIVIAIPLLLLLSPLYLFVALLVRCTSRGPVLYKSQRVGQCGRLFSFYKFRSMHVDADARLEALLEMNEKDGPIFKIADDPRVTVVGRFLRQSSLDELPQLFHVLKGDMSLVGPRPPLPREVIRYGPEHLERLRVKPGITCYWQVMGRSNLTFEQWMELDRKYLHEMGFWTDLKILLRTPLAVLRRDGAC